jgi:protein-disulfide isomerase
LYGFRKLLLVLLHSFYLEWMIGMKLRNSMHFLERCLAFRLLSVLSAILLLLLYAPVQSARCENISETEFAKLLEKVLRERPNLVLDVLRKHSEAVLDIAQQGSNLRRQRSLEKQWDNDRTVEKKVQLDGRPVLGNANAAVRIIAFSDFSCHFCQQAAQTAESIFREFGKDVCLIFKHLPLDEKGVGHAASTYFAAIALQSEDRAWAFYHTLFANRDRLVAEGETYLQQLAKDLKLDMDRLHRDVKSKKVRNILRQDWEDAKQLGIGGTPYFLVNNLVVRGALPLDLFRVAVQKALQDSGRK